MPILQIGDSPRVGQPFVVAVVQTPPLVPCALLLATGAANPPWLPPAPFDVPDCPVRVDLAWASTLWQLTDPLGRVQMFTAVPAALGLIGLQVYVQGVPVTVATGQVRLLTTPLASVSVRGPAVDHASVEDFDHEAMLDVARSAATWSGGVCRFHDIGGDGRHGDFTPSLGTFLGTIDGYATWRIDTDLTVIPADRTLNGVSTVVTDGRFQFAALEVPANVRIVFTGNSPPVFTVAGRLRVAGMLDVAGADLLPPTFPPAGVAPGQTGGAPGAFGGRGGQGGDRCLGTGPLLACVGRDGQDCRVLAGHAYAMAVTGTGGRGSPLFPVAGTTGAIAFAPGSNWCGMATSGGGGGGFWLAGGSGNAVTNSWPDPTTGLPPDRSLLGPITSGGIALSLLPVPAGARSTVHFLVGGAGGGGGGSHPMLTPRAAPVYAPGAGGGGGGGAIALRAGREFDLGPGAVVRANGGSAGGAAGVTTGVVPAPGGGGSGGSILLQSGLGMVADAVLDVRGGLGGVQDRSSATTGDGGSVRTVGGDGAPGSIRAELPVPAPVSLPNAQPPALPPAVLAETDVSSSCRSRAYGSGDTTPPTWLRYEVHATVNGTPVVFSDDPGVGPPAGAGLAPIWFQVAGVTLDAGGQPVPGSERPWRDQVGLHAGPLGLQSDACNGYRFRLVVFRVYGDVVVDRVTVVYRR